MLIILTLETIKSRILTIKGILNKTKIKKRYSTCTNHLVFDWSNLFCSVLLTTTMASIVEKFSRLCEKHCFTRHTANH